jgi:hypothetical protein
MFVFFIISYLLIAFMLMNMMAKVRPWRRSPAPGKFYKSVPMGLASRIRLHRFSLMALTTGIVHGLITAWMPVQTAGMIGVFAVIIVLLPMHYSLTTKGVSMGDGIFYPWDTFSGFISKRSSLELTHPSFWGRLTLFIQPAEMNSVSEYVARHVKDSSTNL